MNFVHNRILKLILNGASTMKTITKYKRTGWATIVAITITLFMSAAPAYAGIGNEHERNEHKPTHDSGGSVLPAEAEPKGYSLSDMARVTAAFNVTTDQNGNHNGTPPEVVNGTLFQELYTTPTNTFDVRGGTMLYVPVVQITDSPPVIGNFPNVRDRKALVRYFYSHRQVGTVYTRITVDGKVTELDKDYLVGVNTRPLPDGGGTQYMNVAAFLTPLKKGQHTVEISFRAEGDALCEAIGGCPPPYQFSTVYTVKVSIDPK
jgi:hypothetical protein